MALNTVDCSNYTGPLSAAALAAWKAIGVEYVIVQAVAPPPGYPPEVDKQQAQAVIDAGLKLGAYVFNWTQTSIARQNADRFEGYGFTVERWWGDFEDTSAGSATDREQEIASLLAYLDGKGGRREAGAYSGKWWTDGYLPAGSQVFAGRVIGAAQYDGVDTLDAVAFCGGTVTWKQYAGTSTLAGVGNVDLGVSDPSEFGDFPNVPPDPIPPDPADPCAAITIAHDALVVTVADIADRLGDALLAECARPSVRKSVIRGIVQQMANERLASIGPRS